MKKEKVLAFAKKWLDYFSSVDFNPHNEKPEFGLEALDVGFESSWDRLAEMGREFGIAMVRDAKANADKITDIQTLGDTILAKYRDYRMDYIIEYDQEWFIAALKRLIELCEVENNGQNGGKP